VGEQSREFCDEVLSYAHGNATNNYTLTNMLVHWNDFLAWPNRLFFGLNEKLLFICRPAQILLMWSNQEV
jgi:hypothetical protein